MDVGQALTQIRDAELYKAEHKTFEAYCSERWGFKRSYAYDLMKSAAVAENVRHAGQGLPAPANPRQASELAKLPPKEQPQAWAEAVKTAPDGVVTAKHVAAVVADAGAALPRREVQSRACLCLGRAQCLEATHSSIACASSLGRSDRSGCYQQKCHVGRWRVPTPIRRRLRCSASSSFEYSTHLRDSSVGGLEQLLTGGGARFGHDPCRRNWSGEARHLVHRHDARNHAVEDLIERGRD